MITSMLRVAVLVACSTVSLASGLEPLWTYPVPLGTADSSPAVADVDLDGHPEVVLTTTGGSVILIDSRGQQVWMRGIQIPISLPPTVVDLVEGPELEVLVLNQTGSLFCLDGRTGDTIWRYDLPGAIEWGVSAITAVDLDGDGHPEVIAGDQDGHVVCLSSEGAREWQYDGPQGSTYCPAAGPLGKETKASILISGPRVPLVCLDGQGKERWRVNRPGKGASPILADIDGDGGNEVLTASGHAVMAVDASGEPRWLHPMKKEIDSSLCVADADQDGIVEVYAIDLAGHLVAIAPDGTTLWTANVRERVRRSPAVGDIDGDGAIEVVVAGYSGDLYLFTAKGELKESHPLPSVTNASPLLADLSGDGLPTLLLALNNGALNACRWPEAKPGAVVLWPQYRFNAARTGLEARQVRSPVRIRSVHFGDFYVGDNTVTVAVENPEERELTVAVNVDTGHDKARTQRVQRADREFEVQVKYVLSGVAPSLLRIECAVYDRDQRLTQRRSTTYVVPFRKELADLRRALERVEAASRELPDAFALFGEVAAVRTRLPDYERQAAIAGTLDDVARRGLRDALRAELEWFHRLDKLATVARAHHTDGRWPVRLSAANPWAPSGGFDEILEDRLPEASLFVESFSGETESAALNLFNFGTRTLTARVELDELVSADSNATNRVKARDVFQLQEVVDVPTQTLDYSADALPRLNQGHLMVLPAWDARQLWLTVDSKRLSPGVWKSAVHVRTLELEPREFTAPVTITVWKPALPAVQPLRHCNWGYVHGSRHQEYEAQSLEDRVAHGNNVFVTGFVPLAKFDAQGELVGPIDYQRHDEFVRRYAPHGLILFQMTGGISGPGDRESDAYRRAYKTWMKAWVKHLQELGVSYEGYAMYPVDEPGLHDGLVALYLFYAKLTREADPKLRMYTDPVHRITQEELTEMLPYVDIWCPNRIGFLLDVGADKWEIIKNSGGQLWTYECEGNAKHQSPLGYYRGQSWLAWRHGLTGIGFWSYCTSSADPWFKPTNTQDYLMVYQGESVVASKRWEAVRDGIEDYSMLTVLREALAKAKAAGVSADAVTKAEALLGERAQAISRFCNKDDTTPGKTGLPGARKLADQQWTAIRQFRRELAETIERLAVR